MKHKPQPINRHADSIYCAQFIPRLPAPFIRTKMMASLDFRTLVLQAVFQQRQHPTFVSLIRAHNPLLGMLMRHHGL